MVVQYVNITGLNVRITSVYYTTVRQTLYSQANE